MLRSVCQELFLFFWISFWRNSFTLYWPYKLCPALRTTVWQLRRLLCRHAACSERRKRDLNPRAGFPTYTLSRGASSASWVFLLITVANYHLLSLSGELARRRIYYTSSVSFCQQLFPSFLLFSPFSELCVQWIRVYNSTFRMYKSTSR